MAIVYEIRQNDLAEEITATLKKNGAAVDLTGAEKVLMHMTLKGGEVEVLDIVMDIVGEPVNGEIKHRWEEGENAIAGVYEFEFEVIWTEEKRNSSFPSAEGFYELKFSKEKK